MFKKGKLEKECMEMIAKICMRNRGIRTGLEILHRAGKQADRDSCETVTADHVRMFKGYY